MSKTKISYICTSCDAIYPAWQGKCNACGQWNTIVRENFDGSKLLSGKKLRAVSFETKSLDGIEINIEREKLAINNFNTILGGGLVKGQVILFAGEPGVGKSTLLTQLCINSDIKILYISGEESLDQIGKRALRLNKIENFNNSKFSNDTELTSILSQIKSKDYDLVIIDSIQTVYSNDIPGFAGSMNQIRECTNYITEEAKKNSVSVIIVGQITKDGSIAGPKILEHTVDTVLYFEGDRRNDTRILKVTKNRFGGTNEIAVFEMQATGLNPIENAEKYFIDNTEAKEGVAYTIYQEGSLSIIIEVQALCTPTSFPYPKRVSNGYNSKRLEMIIAILMKKLSLKLENYDIFINIIGGIKIEDTSADLAVAMAILSSLKRKSLPAKTSFIGELSLTGDIKSVTSLENRIKKSKSYDLENVYSVKNIKNIEDCLKIL